MNSPMQNRGWILGSMTFGILTLVLSALLLIAAPVQAQTKRVVEAAQNVIFTGAQTTVPAKGLLCARGVVLDAAGDILIANSNDSEVIEVPADGGAQFTVGSGLNGPNGVAVDGAGNIFIGDSRNNRVVEVPAGGGAQFTVGTGLKYPGGVAVDAAGDVFIADTHNKRVVEVPAGGGQFTVGSVHYDLDLALDAAGNLFIADTSDNRVVEVPVGGGAQITVCGPGVPACSGLSHPSGVVVDAAGDVFISDPFNQRVVEVPAGGGAQTTVCGPGIPACNGLIYPYGLAVDGTGDLFIVDHGGTVGDCPEPGAGSRVLELQLVAANFGRVDINSSSTLALNYDVAATTKFGVIKVSSQGDFTLNNSTCAGVMSGGSACVVNLAFGPLALGVRTGSVQITDSSGNPLVTTSVQGIGVAATTTALTSAPNPSTYGEAVTFTALVMSSVAGTPPDGETVKFMKGKTVLGTGRLRSGSASFTTSTLKVGRTTVTAVYDGDSLFAASTSNAVTQVVRKAGE
jgi:sugar lactone lactonase YvrE